MSERKSVLKYVGGSAVLIFAGFFLAFGTISPCGIAKKMAMERAVSFFANDEKLKDNPFSGLGLNLMTATVNNIFASMSPSRCAYSAMRMAFGKNILGEEGAANPKIVLKDEKHPSSFDKENVAHGIPTGWQVRRETSPIDDSETVMLSLVSNDTEQDGYTSQPPTTLALRCKEGFTSVVLITADMIATERDRNYNEYAIVTTRYDGEKADVGSFDVSSDRQALFFSKSTQEIKKMLEHEKLVVRYATFDDKERTMTFTLSGLSDKVDLIKNACHWAEEKKPEPSSHSDTDGGAKGKNAASKEKVKEKRADTPQSSGITRQEMSDLKTQLASCWNAGGGARYAEGVPVDIRLSVNQDRTVREARVVDQTRYNADSYFRLAADSALRAVLSPQCSPLQLPPEKYEQWKEITMTFDPSESFDGVLQGLMKSQ